MKKMMFPVVAFVLIASTSVAQNKKTAEVSLCNKTGGMVSVADLQKCNMLMPVDNKLKVSSFKVSFLVKGADGNSAFDDVSVKGNNFSREALDDLQKFQGKISKIVIGDVMAVDASKNEKKIAGIELSVN